VRLYNILVVLIFGTHVGVTSPMMAGLTSRIKNLCTRYFAAAPKKPQKYTFYAPRESYSYFSPHFNMYHFVGIDYTTPNPQVNITTGLNTGIRGFIFPLAINNNLLSIANTGITLQKALTDIADFSGSKNEIIIVHLNNVKDHEKRIEALLKNRKIESLLFRPDDRLKDIEKNAAKTRIDNVAKKEDITIWPRLKWNYANNKLIMITWDSDQTSEYCWQYSDYFTNDLADSQKLITHRIQSIQEQLPKPIVLEAEIRSALGDIISPEKTVEHPTIFYSDVLRAELAVSLGSTTILAMLMLYNYFITPTTSIIWQNGPNYNALHDIEYQKSYTQEYESLLRDNRAVQGKIHEYQQKLVEEKYSAEIEPLRQKYDYWNGVMNAPQTPENPGIYQQLKQSVYEPLRQKYDSLIGVRNPSEGLKLSSEDTILRWKQSFADYRDKSNELAALVRPEALDMVKNLNPELLAPLRDKAADIAKEVAKGVVSFARNNTAMNLWSAYFSQLLGYGAMTLTALAALGIYTSGSTKNLFTVVKQENVPVNPTGVFLTTPLTPNDITTINNENNTVFHAVSQLNRNNFEVINNFQRSFLMKIADRARRLASIGKE